MVQNQTALTDGVGSTHLKYQDYMEQLPGVDRCFLGRCYNAVDSEVARERGGQAQLYSRQTLLTYQKALRKLAKRVCLDPKEVKDQRRILEIRRTRAL